MNGYMNGQSVLPTPYPDELLYSVITRYHLRSNNTSPKWTLREVFGTDNVIPTIDLPSHLGELSRRSIVQGISADHWIDKHTLYPFYAPFIPVTRAQRLRELMIGKDGSGIHALVGITASTVEIERRLVFCPSCYDCDIMRFGEPYWHRVHQIPGVWVCPAHRIILEQLTYPLSDRHGLTVLPISRAMFRSIPVIGDLSDKVLSRLFDIACDLKVLLHSDEFPKLYDSKSVILPRLAELGYVTAGGRIRQRQLQEHFNANYGHEILMRLDSLPDCKDWSWLTFATRLARRAIHPLRQILLIRFLYGSFTAFREYSRYSYFPFGEGPWPCLNKAAAHYRKPVVCSCNVSRCTDTGRPVGTFRCECGFIYSRRGPDRSEEDRFYRGRIRSFGHVWASRLQQCMQEGLSYRAAASILGVDTKTVIKYADVEIGQVENQSATKMDKRFNPQIRSVQIRNEIKPRVDWEKRDMELSSMIVSACKALLSDPKSKPIRITIALIGRRVGKLSWLEKHSDKLPVTMNLLVNYVESETQYQQRRVRWAAEQLAGEWPLKRWKLEKLAGLRPNYSKEVSDEVDRCISQNQLLLPFRSSEETSSWQH